MPTTEFIYNDHQARVTHLVVNAELISLDGDTATVCGRVTEHADPESRTLYDLCQECEEAHP